ncbi:1227_t:CDS:2, partial [Acaulospora colombiana]
DTFPETLWVDDDNSNRRRMELADEDDYEGGGDWTDDDDWTDEDDDFLTDEEGEGHFLIDPEIYRVPIEGIDDDEDPPQLEETTADLIIGDKNLLTLKRLSTPQAFQQKRFPVQPAVFDWMEEVDSLSRWGAGVPPRRLPGNRLGFRIAHNPGDSSSVAAERSSSPALSAPDSPLDPHLARDPLFGWDNGPSISPFLGPMPPLQSPSQREANMSPPPAALSTSTQDPSSSTSAAEGTTDETTEESFLQVPQPYHPPITRWPSPLMPIESLRPNPAAFTSARSIGRSPPLSPGSAIPPWGVDPRPTTRGFVFTPSPASISATEGERRLWTRAMDVMNPRREWSVPVGVVDKAGGVRAWIARREKELSEERQS